MTVTIELPPDVEQAYVSEAEARGLTVEEVVREVLVGARSSASVTTPRSQERIQKYRRWVDSHREDKFPLLSDEAISRESIYGDRGL